MAEQTNDSIILQMKGGELFETMERCVVHHLNVGIVCVQHFEILAADEAMLAQLTKIIAVDV